VHTQLAGRVEQHDVGAATDQPPLAQFCARQGAEQVVLLVDPGDLFGIRSRAVRDFLFRDWT
jgi:hypothetical protein